MSPEKKSDTLSNWKWRAAAENKQLEHKEKWKQRGNCRKAILNNTTRFTTGSRAVSTGVDFVIVIRDYDYCSVSLTVERDLFCLVLNIKGGNSVC